MAAREGTASTCECASLCAQRCRGDEKTECEEEKRQREARVAEKCFRRTVFFGGCVVRLGVEGQKGHRWHGPAIRWCLNSAGQLRCLCSGSREDHC